MIPLLAAILCLLMVTVSMARTSKPAATIQEDDKDKAVERTRKTVRMLDDVYKTAVVLITEHYVNDEAYEKELLREASLRVQLRVDLQTWQTNEVYPNWDFDVEGQVSFLSFPFGLTFTIDVSNVTPAIDQCQCPFAAKAAKVENVRAGIDVSKTVSQRVGAGE